MPAGYSQTPLAKKLGIKSGNKILLFQQPEHYFDLFADWPEDVEIVKSPDVESLDFIHVFFQEWNDLTANFHRFKAMLRKQGMLWISWPKGKSGIPTDISRDPLRTYVLSEGLVDVKVAAVDEQWSGLKFVYRVKDR